MKTLQQFEEEVKFLNKDYIITPLDLGRVLSQARDIYFLGNGSGFRTWFTDLGVNMTHAYKVINKYKRFGHIEDAYKVCMSELHELNSFNEEVDAELIVANTRNMTIEEIRELKVLVNNGQVTLDPVQNEETPEEAIMRLAQTMTKAEMLKLVEKAYPQKGFVYIIRNGKYMKIGKTKDLKQRFSNFKTTMPEFEIVLLLESTEHSKLEKRLHVEFEENRVNGEWFDMSPREVRMIKEEYADLITEKW